MDLLVLFICTLACVAIIGGIAFFLLNPPQDDDQD